MLKPGTLDWCLHDLRSRHANANKLLAEFCDVNYRTASEWKGENFPLGARRVRLYYFLTMCGYTPGIRFSKHPTIQYLGELFALRIISSEQASQLFGVNGGDSYLWNAFWGENMPLSVQKEQLTLEDLREMYDDELTLAKAQVALPGGPVRIDCPATPPPDYVVIKDEVLPTARPPSQSETIGETNSMLVAFTASNLLQCLPLLRQLNAQQDPEVAAQVRDLMGSDNFHLLLDILKGMTSREASKFYREHPSS